MKIRIKGNTIRYRLTKTETETFCRTGYITESTQFPNGTFTYALEAKEGIAHLEATFASNTITLYLPKKDSTEWAIGDTVGFSHILSLETGGGLSLLLEKDFVCLDETMEDQSDNYPNPLADKK